MSMPSSASGPSDPFGDPLNRLFGTPPASLPPAVPRVPIGRTPAGPCPHHTVDRAGPARTAEASGT
ncbi:hypothetical protein [Streptomyces coelicoflavus]|uniref:hypothetical protein n=1 Tax=Streptomyces coelicoflavus TaxID=285562 RepID=UPI002E2632BA